MAILTNIALAITKVQLLYEVSFLQDVLAWNPNMHTTMQKISARERDTAPRYYYKRTRSYTCLERIKNFFRAIIAFFFTQIGVFALLVSYMVFGAHLFSRYYKVLKYSLVSFGESLIPHSDWEAKSVQKKTEPRMRLVPPSKLPDVGLKLVEKQIFHPCPFL